MSEPGFKVGDKVEYNKGGGQWVPVTIWTRALRYVDDKESLGDFHGVRFADDTTNIVYVSNLRLIERWEPCPGKHRHADDSLNHSSMERLVGSSPT